MKHIQLTFTFILFSIAWLMGQAPSNDECNFALNLGNAPICQEEVTYTNFNATASTPNNPSCFQGNRGQRDVWFRFTTVADIQEYVIEVNGKANGPNNRSIGNPQISLYRGTCNGLSELACVSAENGLSSVSLTISNLPANANLFIRVNDYSATTTPNAGDFSICVEEFVPAINMGDVENTNACSGTLFDSGGPDGTYGPSENTTLTICPQTPNACIVFNLIRYDLELGFDVLSFYGGDNITAPLLARVSGSNFGTPFPLQASSDCVTLQFQSDSFTAGAGFELTWECSTNCAPTSLDQATNISGLPFTGSFNSCDVPASFAQTACGTDLFLNGPEKIFTYTSPGDQCVSILLENTEESSGVLVLNAPPTDPNAVCVAESETGFIQSANLTAPGTYYIVVAQPFNCVNFDITIEAAECTLSPALLDALCNPLNGCVNADGIPSQFTFQDGFQDITLVEQVNSGCWQNEGIEADFFWFTIEAQATGKFGFILESADVPSDIDFSVWGPFSSEDACNNKDAIVQVIESSQPIRSSWSPTAGITGLADVHPIFRNPIRDNYDCGTPFIPNFFGDDFVRTIDANEGEIYVVLINDFGNDIEGNGILIDWSPSDRAVLDRLPITVETQDVEICKGESAQLRLSDGIDNISWIPAESLSCNDCLNPIASPEETTIYTAFIEGVCTIDTLQITVEVLGVEAGPDITICSGEEFELNAGSDFENATYEWIAPPEVELSCTDCPNPIITSSIAGIYTITVNLNTEQCPTTDDFRLTVLAQPAPIFEVADDQEICEDEGNIELGSDNNDNDLVYNWTSVPAGFTSNSRNPIVSPTESITYFVSVTNGICPVASMDSVRIDVFQSPEFDLISSTTVCQGDTLVLSSSEPEDGVTYEWRGPGGSDVFEDDALPNTVVFPQSTGNYSLTATRGACSVTKAVEITVIPIGVSILTTLPAMDESDLDTARICLGEEVTLRADPNSTLPVGVIVNWTPNDGSLSDSTGVSVIAKPSTFTRYIATVENMGCVRMDTIDITVDSLPPDLALMPADTMICEGNYVILTSTTYEPFQFPDIEFMWTPATGQQTPDSLFNMVAAPDTTLFYFRMTTNGACTSLDSARIEVNPIPIIEIRPADAAICSGESVDLQVVSLNDVPIESYMWEPMDGLSCGDCATPTASMSGSFNVQVMSDKMCPGAASIFIQELESPALQLATNETLCPGESVELNSVASSDATYVWETNDPNFTDTDNPTPTVTPGIGTFNYSVTASNGSCPDATGMVTLTVIDPASAAVTIDPMNPTTCSDNPVTLNATVTGVDAANLTFTWSELTANSSVELDETSSTLIVQPIGDRTYLVEVEGDFACLSDGFSDSTTVFVVSTEVAVPNAFVPSSSNPLNNQFRLFYATADAIDFRIMEIFDRWGNLVFETTTLGDGWNGERNGDGAPLPSDVYAYRIVYVEQCGNSQEEITLTGKVILVR